MWLYSKGNLQRFNFQLEKHKNMTKETNCYLAMKLY